MESLDRLREDRERQLKAKQAQADAAWYEERAIRVEQEVSKLQGPTVEKVARQEAAIRARVRATERASRAKELNDEILRARQ